MEAQPVLSVALERPLYHGPPTSPATSLILSHSSPVLPPSLSALLTLASPRPRASDLFSSLPSFQRGAHPVSWIFIPDICHQLLHLYPQPRSLFFISSWMSICITQTCRKWTPESPQPPAFQFVSPTATLQSRRPNTLSSCLTWLFLSLTASISKSCWTLLQKYVQNLVSSHCLRSYVPLTKVPFNLLNNCNKLTGVPAITPLQNIFGSLRAHFKIWVRSYVSSAQNCGFLCWSE